MARPKKPPALRRKHRMMIYLTEQEQQHLKDLSDSSGLDQTDLIYEGLHTVFRALKYREVDDMNYPKHKDNSSLLDGQKELYNRKLGEWLSGDPCKVRFFANEYANQRGVVQVVEIDHCLVQLYGQKEPVQIATTDLIYWDGEDESWVIAPGLYRDDEDLNSEDAPKEDQHNADL